MEALKSLGIDWKLLIAQVVNFLILLLILAKFLYKPIVKMLDERSEKIKSGLADAERSSKELAMAEEEAEKIVEKAYMEANQILSQSKLEAESEAKTITANAENEVKKILDDAHTEIKARKNLLTSDAKKEISTLLFTVLNKVTSQINQEEREKISEEALREFE